MLKLYELDIKSTYSEIFVKKNTNRVLCHPITTPHQKNTDYELRTKECHDYS